MIEKLKLNKGNGQMSVPQKKRFLRFVIEKQAAINSSDFPSYHTAYFSFCALYRDYFGIDRMSNSDQIFSTIPEFNAYRPEIYFECNYFPTNDANQFWFKLNPDGIKKRTNICKKILKEL